MDNPFLNGADKLSSALARFQHGADELWRVIDSCTSTLQKIDVEDYPDPFKALGFLRAAVNHYCGTLSDSQAAVDKMMGLSKKALKPLQSHIDSSAMKYGLNRLPTELLSRIFLDATSNVKSTIRLSRVSKQFRSIVIQSPAFWQRFWLLSTWDQERILVVAERSAFRSLKADISGNGKDLDSITAIFSLHSCLEELEIFHFSMEYAEEVRRRLGFLHFPRLQVLHSSGSEILALQHPQQTIEMPSLRILNVDFLPHNLMARNLVELFLVDLGKVSLTSLLDFLSSTNVLEVLNILLETEVAEEDVSGHEPVRLPRLVKLFLELRISMRATSTVARKIRSSSLRTLVLRGDGYMDGYMDTTSDGPFQDILQSNPSFTELDLSLFASIDLCHIPPQVEVLTLKFSSPWNSIFKCSGTVNSHRIRLVRFCAVGSSRPKDFVGIKNFVNDIRDVLLRSGLDGVHLEFQNCWRCRNGSFSLEDVHRAFIDDDDDEDDYY